MLVCLCFSLLHSDRDPIPDVPAVYFVMPTEENIDRICQVKTSFHTQEYNYNIECRNYWLSNISLLYDLYVFNCNDVIIFMSVCVKDLRNQLYDSYYLNFISAISRSKLEDIASAALAANAVNQVTKVILVILTIYSLISVR